MAFRLNPAGLAEILNGAPMQAALREAGEKVAENVRAQQIKVGDENGGADEIPLPVEVEIVKGKTAVALVTLTHPAGNAVQAKHGTLTKAAAQAGLSVKGSA